MSTFRILFIAAMGTAVLLGVPAAISQVARFKTNEVGNPAALPDYNALIDKLNAPLAHANNSVNVVPLFAGGNATLVGPRENYICTGTCTITVPPPVIGYEFCVMNDDAIATVITLAALGSSASYEATARTAYGTAGTGTLTSGAAAANLVCLLGRDATHYLTVRFNGTWTAS